MECACYDKFTAYPQKLREWDTLLSRISFEFLDGPVFGGSLKTRCVIEVPSAIPRLPACCFNGKTDFLVRRIPH